jgi:D-aminoacyl-tRNA deacylase
VIAVAISRDPVAKGVARELGLAGSPGASYLSTARMGDLLVLFYDGDSVEPPPEDELRRLGVSHLVVPSRHEMARPRPMLTAHTPGVAPSLSVAHASLKSWLFRRICSEKPEGFDCALEATHHAPNTEEVSVTFIEVGSTEKEWGDPRALRALASALGELPQFGDRAEAQPVMSVGDLHYSLLTSEVLNGAMDVGHIIHKDVATADLALRALAKHVVAPKKVVIYRKSLKGPIRRDVIDVLRRRVELDVR